MSTIMKFRSNWIHQLVPPLGERKKIIKWQSTLYFSSCVSLRCGRHGSIISRWRRINWLIGRTEGSTHAKHGR
jgi:hypothetical protein